MPIKRITHTDPADILRDCREASGEQTIYAAAKATGEPISTLQRIEAGTGDPSVGVLRRVLAKLGWRLKLVAEREKR